MGAVTTMMMMLGNPELPSPSPTPTPSVTPTPTITPTRSVTPTPTRTPTPTPTPSSSIPALRLYTWGFNQFGPQGHGDQISRSSPVQVGALTNWFSVSNNSSSHTAAIKTDGTLWTWGLNNRGQLGLNVNYQFNYSSPKQVGLLTTWSRVSAGGSHTAAIKSDGTLWAWGYNGNGQLGLDNRIYRSSPVQVGALTNWSSVVATYKNSAAIKTDGTLWTWGSNIRGYLGINTSSNNYSSPVQVGALTNWKSVDMKRNSTMAIKTDGTLWTWGRNNFGQLGLNLSYNIGGVSSPTQVGSLTTWAVAVAGYSAAAIKTDGTLWTWGINGFGQLGIGNFTSMSSPVQVGALTDWLSVGSGGNFMLALKTNGTLWAWGYNGRGYLGLNNRINQNSPVQVGALTTWSLITAGSISGAITKN